MYNSPWLCPVGSMALVGVPSGGLPSLPPEMSADELKALKGTLTAHQKTDYNVSVMEAQQASKDGRYDVAIRLFTAAMAIFPDPKIRKKLVRLSAKQALASAQNAGTPPATTPLTVPRTAVREPLAPISVPTPSHAVTRVRKRDKAFDDASAGWVVPSGSPDCSSASPRQRRRTRGVVVDATTPTTRVKGEGQAKPRAKERNKVLRADKAVWGGFSDDDDDDDDDDQLGQPAPRDMFTPAVKPEPTRDPYGASGAGDAPAPGSTGLTPAVTELSLGGAASGDDYGSIPGFESNTPTARPRADVVQVDYADERDAGAEYSAVWRNTNFVKQGDDYVVRTCQVSLHQPTCYTVFNACCTAGGTTFFRSFREAFASPKSSWRRCMATSWTVSSGCGTSTRRDARPAG